MTSSNYAITFLDGSLTINKAPLTVTANNASKTYDGQAYLGGNGVSYSTFANNETSSALAGTLSYTGTSQGATNAGSYAITPSGLTSSNYAITYLDGSLTINKAPLTVTANNASKTYGDANPSLTTTVSGFVNGETLGSSGVSGSGSATTTATAATGSGTAVITAGVGNLTAANYDFINLVNGTLSIEQATISGNSNNANVNGGVNSNANNSGGNATPPTSNNSPASNAVGVVQAAAQLVAPVTNTAVIALPSKSILNLTETAPALAAAETPVANNLSPAPSETISSSAPVLAALPSTIAGPTIANSKGTEASTNTNTLAVADSSDTDNNDTPASTTNQRTAATPKTEVITPAEGSRPTQVAQAAPAKSLPSPGPLTDVSRMTGQQVRNLTADQLNALPADQLASLRPLQLQALTTAQLSQLKPEKVDILSPTQLAVMSPRQRQSLPTATAPDAKQTNTGVLAITILSTPESKPTSAGVAFEQDVNSVTLKSVAAPPAASTLATNSDTLVFKDKLSTFMVASSSGELVEFQGSLINMRMVIVAPTPAAKAVARLDMNLVLAAAITSLGQETRVMLAQLEGVVFDLR